MKEIEVTINGKVVRVKHGTPSERREFLKSRSNNSGNKATETNQSSTVNHTTSNSKEKSFGVNYKGLEIVVTEDSKLYIGNKLVDKAPFIFAQFGIPFISNNVLIGKIGNTLIRAESRYLVTRQRITIYADDVLIGKGFIKI